MTGHAVSVAKVTSSTVQWAQEIEGAKMLMRSGLLPTTIKSPEAALFVILTGRDLGLSPVQSLRSINIIKGKVEVAADMQLGLFHREGGKSQWVELTNDKAVLKLAAPWLIEPHTEVFEMADAKRAGLDRAASSGEPSMFAKFPRAMLRSRAITAGLKSIGFDPTAGMYAPGEIGGPEDVPAAPEVIHLHGKPPIIVPIDPEDIEPDAFKEEPDEALTSLELLLPNLTVDQQIYVREKLADGADPARLLAVAQATAGRA